MLTYLASLHGCIQHYSTCIPYILSYVALNSSFIGAEDNPDYDHTSALPRAVNKATKFVCGVLEDYAISASGASRSLHFRL